MISQWERCAINSSFTEVDHFFLENHSVFFMSQELISTELSKFREQLINPGYQCVAYERGNESVLVYTTHTNVGLSLLRPLETTLQHICYIPTVFIEEMFLNWPLAWSWHLDTGMYELMVKPNKRRKPPTATQFHFKHLIGYNMDLYRALASSKSNPEAVSPRGCARCSYVSAGIVITKYDKSVSITIMSWHF